MRSCGKESLRDSPVGGPANRMSEGGGTVREAAKGKGGGTRGDTATLAGLTLAAG